MLRVSVGTSEWTDLPKSMADTFPSSTNLTIATTETNVTYPCLELRGAVVEQNDSTHCIVSSGGLLSRVKCNLKEGTSVQLRIFAKQRSRKGR